MTVLLDNPTNRGGGALDKASDVLCATRHPLDPPFRPSEPAAAAWLVCREGIDWAMASP
jgi:hypothetical protein